MSAQPAASYGARIELDDGMPIEMILRCIAAELKRMGYKNCKFFTYTNILCYNINGGTRQYFNLSDDKRRRKWLVDTVDAMAAYHRAPGQILPPYFVAPTTEQFVRACTEAGIPGLNAIAASTQLGMVPVTCALFLELGVEDRRMWVKHGLKMLCHMYNVDDAGV